MFRKSLLLLIVTIACPNALADPPESGTQDLFYQTQQVPGDVDLYLHVVDAEKLRRELADYRLGQWFRSYLDQGDLAKVWGEIAQQVDVPGGQLFDLCFGKSVILLQREIGSIAGQKIEYEPQIEWALLTEVDPDAISPVFRKLNLKHHTPRQGKMIAELPEQSLLLSFNENQLIIGSTRSSDLFDQLIQLGNANDSETLSAKEPLRKSNTLSGGRIGLMMQHDPPLGGWSLAVGDLVAGQVELRYRGQFEHSPIQRGVTKITWDASQLQRFEDQAALVLIEPTDIGESAVSHYLQALIGQPMFSPAFRKHIGETRILVIDEQDPPTDSLEEEWQGPAVSLSWPIAYDPDLAESHLDESLCVWIDAVNEKYNGQLIESMPRHRDMISGRARRIALNSDVDLFEGALLSSGDLSLNWVISRSQQQDFAVVASDPDHLQHTIERLRQPVSGVFGEEDTWASCGFAHGMRLSRYLNAYGELAEKFVLDDKEAREQFQQTVTFAVELAACIRYGQWRLLRPTEKEVSFTIELELTAQPTVVDRE